MFEARNISIHTFVGLQSRFGINTLVARHENTFTCFCVFPSSDLATLSFGWAVDVLAIYKHG